MKAKNKKESYLCKFVDDSLHVIRYLDNNFVKEFMDLNIISPAVSLKDAFQKLGYSNNSVILSLPRGGATTRYLRIPARSADEVEGIVSLQASRYLPYPNEDLTTAYEIINVDRHGYSYVNLIIAHKDTVNSQCKVFKELNILNPNVYLSSYGIYGLYTYLNKQDNEPVIVFNIDSYGVEAVGINNKKLIFSRGFKLNKSQQNWDSLLAEEAIKTTEAFIKDSSLSSISKVFIVGPDKISKDALGVLGNSIKYPAQILEYKQKINIRPDLLNALCDSNNSYFDLIGLGLKSLSSSLNIIPENIKKQMRKSGRQKEQIKFIIIILGIIFIWFLALAKNLDNKAKYLALLRQELVKVYAQAKPLDDIDKRLKLLRSQTSQKPSALDFLYEVNRVVNTGVTLNSFIYDDTGQIILRGQAQELNLIFAFVAQLEKLPAYNDFNIKIRYATKKNTQYGEVVDFEVGLLRK